MAYWNKSGPTNATYADYSIQNDLFYVTIVNNNNNKVQWNIFVYSVAEISD